jgi:signal transduction histidine kinase/DNA-binding response OmpR family regulator
MKRGSNGLKTVEKEIYKRELDLLEKLAQILETKNLAKDELFDQLGLVRKEYNRLFKSTIKVSRISDANQRKLIRMLDLEQENLRLEKLVNQRAKEIEEKNRVLQEQSEKLTEMDKIKSRFFSNISHEFRTPLTLIMGPLEQMIEDCPENDPERKRKLTLVLRNAQRLLRLINQLLDLSKLDSGKLTLQAQKNHILHFVKGIASSFSLLARQYELELAVYAGAGEDQAGAEDILLYFDTVKMEDALCNLLINAIKFTPAGGVVSVTVKEVPPAQGVFSAGAVEISVSDTGPGIPAEHIQNIFDRFYQGGAASSYQQKGTGIGLALTKELVELHYGTIEAAAQEGEGSRFTIRLPKGNAHLSPEEIIAEPASKTQPSTIPHDTGEFPIPEITGEDPETHILSPGKSGTENIILVVEDSTDIREYIKKALEPHYSVVEAANGREGIQLAREIIPDLIISDLLMPEVDGYQLCRTLKEEFATSHIPVILLTAKASEEDMVTGLEAGADDYVTKPFSTKILHARIKNLIDLRRHLQQTFNREMTRQPVSISVSSIDKEFVRNLKTAIEDNLSDPEFNVEQLCRILSVSRPTLYRKLQALSGESPTDLLRSFRLKRASQLLESRSVSVTEVAFETGFASRTYFTKCFKEKFHVLPSEYMEGRQSAD